MLLASIETKKRIFLSPLWRIGTPPPARRACDKLVISRMMVIEGWPTPSTTTRAKEDMITQSIKQWLNRLFAWLPWRRSTETGYTQAVSNLNSGVTQEPLLRSTVDGPLPQTGTTSVAVDQGRDEEIPESSRPTTEERPEQVVSSHPPLAEDTASPRHPSEALKESTTVPPPSPTPEQKLAFLQYLVKRGIVNEGFSEGQVPRQYKKAQS
jgi:hypothetical protein